MVSVYFIIISAILMITELTPSSSGSSLQLVENGNGLCETSTQIKLQRHTRNIPGLNFVIKLLTEPLLEFVPSISNSITSNFKISGHTTPDYSNGLDYPDPLLITGPAAKRAIAHLYSKELFYDNIPHIRAILQNQKKRKTNGLSYNRLGSIRNDSPFYRYKNQEF